MRPDLVEAFGRARVTHAARRVLEEARGEATGGQVPSVGEIEARLAARLALGVRGAINATGVVLHTNLGRAPWSERAIEAAARVAGYATVEIDGRTGRRGRRGEGAEERICALTGADAALVVNNCAAALVLALAALARGRKVVVSRGQLVEIGGGFRVPEIMEASGATLLEVGTTNRTHMRDYDVAIAEDVAAVLWVHHSNFRQVGFVAQPSLAELGLLARPLIVDLGSGALESFGEEPSVAEALRAGASVVCFSGDKLLGGPQAGILVGKADVLEGLRRHPLQRALRPDKVTIAALEATLDDWLRDDPVPVRRMIDASVDDLRAAVRAWARELPEWVRYEIRDVEAAIGGGSAPGRTWPSVALAILSPSPELLRAALLGGDPPVVGRIQDGALLLDARTVHPLGHSRALLRALAPPLRTGGLTR
jgi:L-seryl-tRNA(Ser) seleniumtransferase